MLNIVEIRIANTFTFGNETHTIRYQNNEPVFVVGENGAGKTGALIDCLFFGLFGQPYRKLPKASIINSITKKGALVEVDLIASGKAYTVIRGMKPSRFEVYENGQPLAFSDVPEGQRFLESNILRLNAKTARQIVVLGSRKYVPFMSLSTPDRRKMVEDILDIEIFTEMNKALKARATEIKDELTAITHQLAVAEKELEVEERHREQALQALAATNRDREAELVKVEADRMAVELEIDSTKVEMVNLEGSIQDRAEVRKRMEEIKAEVIHTVQKRQNAADQMTFYRVNENCPTCNQRMDENHRQQHTVKLAYEIDDAKAELNALKGEAQRTGERLEQIIKIESWIGQHNTNLAQAQYRLTVYDEAIKSLRGRMVTERQAVIVDEGGIEGLKVNLVNLRNQKESALKKAKVMGHAGLLLKDDGIKARLIAQYIPLMNQIVNKYLAAMGLYVNMTLDENFNETFLSRGWDEFSYENFSSGEQARIDIALLMTWRDIARLRNSAACDLLIFDENLDGVLDTEGIDNFLKIIKEVTKNTNVFIITHREMMKDEDFGNTLKFIKRSNFSQIHQINA
jgi:DNA repair exonuclease SbcCD ATPase subunit